MKFIWIILMILLFTGCVPSDYQFTVYDSEEFIQDSHQMAEGKQAILQLENQSVNKEILSDYDFYEETIIDGDILTLVFYHPKRQDHIQLMQLLSQQSVFYVSNGHITLPHMGCLEVGGLTLREAREKVQQIYCHEWPETQVFINFKQRRERFVQVIGATRSAVPVNGYTRLSEVLAQANISPYANLFKSYVMREDKQLPIDLYQLIHEGDESQNIVMRGGDQIFIACITDANVMITGEVRYPFVIPVPYGFISLRQALVMVGGIPFTGDKCNIQVIRGNLKRPKIYILDWKSISHVPNQSLLLIPGDVVVVSAKPITQWNRFINQLQPSLTNTQTSCCTYQMFYD